LILRFENGCQLVDWGVAAQFKLTFEIAQMTFHISNCTICILCSKRGDNFDFWNSETILKALDAEAQSLVEAVGLAEFSQSQAVELSYGRKRALEIATTLALDPEMMLLDEPMAGMGHEDVDRIAELIRRVSANRTILMVEHNLSVVASLSDFITVLARGKVLAEGDYATVSKDPRVIEAYIGAGHG